MLNRRQFLSRVTAGAGLLSLGALPGCMESASSKMLSLKKQPNVLLVNIDDMGYGDMSCHGNPHIKTPNIDKLYSQSLRFPQFHSAPMCTPTRGMLLTGVEAMKNGARWVGTENTHLRTDLPTIAEMFRDAGYRTGLFGKWHVGDNYPMRPQDRGFQDVITFPQQEVGTVNDHWGNDYIDDTYSDNGVLKPYKGFCTDVWFNEAMKWMKDRNDKNERFMCWIPTNVVHGPYYSTDEDRARIDTSDKSKDMETFVGMVVNLDDNIGRLLHFMDDQGLSDDTILIFMTDNGVTMGWGLYNAGMRGLKTMLWEGGHRVPLFIRWPNGSLRAPGDIHGLVQVHDLTPTLLELCNVPPAPAAKFDGMSIAPQLRGEKDLPDRILVVQFQRQLQMKKWDCCIMYGPWRLLNVRDIDPNDPPEVVEELQRRRRKYEINLGLYNVEKDPHQDHDVIDQHPDIVAKMKAHYETWWADVEPWLEMEHPVVIGSDAENPSYLCATAWAETYFTQMSNVLDGRPANGWWNLVVDRPGEYEFELRRWPREAMAPIAGTANIYLDDDYVYGPVKKGKALPITEARIQIMGHDQRVAVAEHDTNVKFRLRLNRGKARLRTWFYDANGKSLCGAYYVYATRL